MRWPVGFRSRRTRQRWRTLGQRIALAIALSAGSGCGWFQTPQQPYVATDTPVDIATGVSVVGTPFHRVSVRSSDPSDSTRLVILYVRIESVAEETFSVRPGGMTLVQADGTIGSGLDPDRAQALLERGDLLIVDADPALHDPFGLDRTAEAQDSVRRVIQDELLTEAEVQRDRVVRGYLVVDTRRAQPSFDGATLQIGLTRLTDGAEMRQLYRFEPAPVATADTPADTAQ